MRVEFVEAAVGLVGRDIRRADDDTAVFLGAGAADSPIDRAEHDQRESGHDSPVGVNVRQFHQYLAAQYAHCGLKTTRQEKTLNTLTRRAACGLKCLLIAPALLQRLSSIQQTG